MVNTIIVNNYDEFTQILVIYILLVRICSQVSFHQYSNIILVI